VRLERLRIENFRVLTGPVELGPFDPRLTVIAGANEDGKSTVLDALRTALFEKHRITGAGADRLRPWGRDVAPEVTVAFEHEGAHWVLEKRFCRKPTARLQCLDDGREWQDDAAEDELETLLGFSRPGRGSTDASHQGLWGLLWVEQGQAHGALRTPEGARARLGDALEDEVGDVLGGSEGRALAARIEARYREHWTSTGRPTGEYGRLLRDSEALEQELAEVEGRLADWDEDLVRLEDRVARLEGLDRDGVVARLQGAEHEAREAVEGLAELERALEKADAAARFATLEHESAVGALETRRALVAEADRAGREAEAAQEALSLESAAAGEAERAADAARRDHEAASARLAAARAAAARKTRREERVRLDRERRELEERLRQIGAREAAVAEARADASSSRATPERLEALRRARREQEAVEARARAGATTVRFEGVVLRQVEGEARAEDDQWLVTGPARFVLPDGIVEVRPAEEGSGDLRAERDRRARGMAEALAALGADDPEQAEAAGERRAAAVRRLADEEARLEALAPEGVDRLRMRLAELEARAAREDEADPPEEAPTDPSIASVEACEATVLRTEAAWSAARDAFDEVRTRREGARAREAERRANAARVRERLARARAERSDETLEAAVAAAETARAGAAEAQGRAREALEAADGELLRARLEDAGRALADARAERATLEREILQLRSALRASGREGLAELHADRTRSLTSARRRLAALGRRAAAARLAREALQEAASSARERFLAPVRARLAPALARVLPEAELRLDEQLEIEGIERGGTLEPFEDLSLGTREQLAVLVRLAFAELLAEQGRPVPVVLDDALVYADDRRFADVQDVLRLAARRHQIVVLTCHERLWRGLGGTLLRIGEAS
jgi:chromosome segregation ATPase